MCKYSLVLKRLFAGGPPAIKNLFAGSRPTNKNLFAGGPPENKKLFAGGPPENKNLFAGTLSVLCSPEWSLQPYLVFLYIVLYYMVL